MEARGWRGDRAGRVREDSLITRIVFGIALTTEVWRQRHGTTRVKIDIFIERDDALAFTKHLFDARSHAVDFKRRADPHFAPGFGQTLPTQRAESFDE